MADDLDDTIRENAEGPEEAGADGVRVKRHGLKDQIEGDKYLAGKAAARFGRWGRSMLRPYATVWASGR